MNQTSLADIKPHYVLEGRSLDAATEAALRADPRPGAGAILQAIARRRFENRAESQRLRRLTRFERALWDKGILHVAGDYLTLIVRGFASSTFGSVRESTPSFIAASIFP